ncbi:Gfo/Idh/MocA family protein [Paenibacillus sp. FJAT-27812]|uniref:Gfo/Idh/MocA family protein n=1 Tax=Paenibacillus sp. FJAT-27812 TaxID=1684143 RepID=UPI0006A763CE|nr:Gfo/Idh/MocA family oxidoreductase [Paenibacillus sp. FJAT-27812]
MKVVVLGCGGLGHVHADAYTKLEGVELTGVCDLQTDQADKLSEQTGAPAFYSFEQMLANAEFDVISITLPSYLHKEYTLLAAKARKHVICEKPMALSLEDADEMMKCCENNGVRLFIGHVVRFFPEYVSLKQSLDSGAIGRACVAHASRAGSHPGDAKPWYKDRARSGGVIVDLMIHDLDFLRWTLGEVKTVYAMLSQNEQLEYALVTLQFESGAIANVEANWGFPGPFHTKAEIAGNAGVVMANSLKSSSLQIHKHANGTSAPTVAIPESPAFKSPYELEIEHFIRCIRDGSEAIVTAKDAYKALEIAYAALESARTGKPVQL